ncbi:MAG: hypothetical protein IT439_08450 [Phycisphaerales bacterium]|nr:hypothetical protein [Phycisphaerales bacterium]
MASPRSLVTPFGRIRFTNPCRTAVGSLVLGLLTLLLGACGEGSPGGPGVDALAAAFKNGSIINAMTEGERLAFSSMGGRGFRPRGRYVFEGTGGVQYRIVRSEWVELDATELKEKAVVRDEVLKRVTDGEITGVAIITLERLPGKKFLEAHASELVMGGAVNGVQVAYTLVRSGKNKWNIANEETRGVARGLFNAYDGHKDLKADVSRTELAKRLVTTAPKAPAEPAPAPQGG